MSTNINSALKKKYGSAFYGSAPPPIERVSTGILGLDYILGGGIPMGRFLEISSAASCGKTTTAVQIIKSFQAQGIPTAYLDLERTLDKQRMADLGVGEKDFYYFRPSDGEQTVELILDMSNFGVRFLVIDSVPFLVPKSDLAAEVGKISISPQARLISREQSKVVSAVEQTQCSVLFINQLRDKIGGYGGGKDTTGGNALKYLCSVRLQIFRKQTLTDGTGMMLTYKTIKNKTASEGLTTDIEFKYESGLNAKSSWKAMLELEGFILRAGSYYKFSPEIAKEFKVDEKIGQGLNGVMTWIDEHPEVYKALSDRLIKTLGT